MPTMISLFSSFSLRPGHLPLSRGRRLPSIAYGVCATSRKKLRLGPVLAIGLLLSLGCLAGSQAMAAPSPGASSPSASSAATSKTQSKLPPVRQITQGPKFHWFGYYDKLEFDPSSRYVLSNEVDFEGRSPRAEDTIRIGMVDLKDNDRWIELGQSNAWSWQQGCMLQWIPGTASSIIWNDREGDRFVARTLDVKTGKRGVLPLPVYALSPDGIRAISADFRRIQNHRPGYGYAGLADPTETERMPRTSGIWLMDLRTGENKLVVSIAQAAAIPLAGAEPEEFAQSFHWFNHLLFNTDGTRFLFLHRWRPDKGSKWADKYKGVGGWGTRMFTANVDGSGLYVLDPYGKTSHFVWRDPKTVTAWSWHPSDGSRFYHYHDLTQNVEVVGRDIMVVNGHNTYLAAPYSDWILNDTYPDKARNQNPYLFHVPTARRVPLGHFRLPPEYKGEWRCDTHPRSDPSGTKVVVDSAHNGGRQLYLIDIASIVRGRDR